MLANFESVDTVGMSVLVALLSDVHSNLPALRAVLAHLGRPDGEGAGACTCAAPPRVDALWCLGDTVGYNAHPGECLELVRRHCAVVLLGNHDWAAVTGDTRVFNPNAAAGVAHSRRVLPSKDVEYLESLAPAARIGDALLCHGSPDDPLWEYVDVSTARSYLTRPDLPRVVAFGHTHVPFILESGARRVLNVGSVGQPRDGDPRAAFVTLDTETGETFLHRVAYDVDAAAQAVKEAGLPRVLGERLYLGR